ncbi:hypothetical protein GH733_014830 [Mirounga leonina]|nr:hypothetical protein GH733_014830 [Mirounga leonina]
MERLCGQADGDNPKGERSQGQENDWQNGSDKRKKRKHTSPTLHWKIHNGGQPNVCKECGRPLDEGAALDHSGDFMLGRYTVTMINMARHSVHINNMLNVRAFILLRNPLNVINARRSLGLTQASQCITEFIMVRNSLNKNNAEAYRNPRQCHTYHRLHSSAKSLQWIEYGKVFKYGLLLRRNQGVHTDLRPQE